MHKVFSAVMVVLVALMCSCSSDDPETDSVNQAETANWIHPDCKAAALESPGQQQNCNGPWVYDYQEWWKDHAACGDTNNCMVRNACTSWDLNTQGDGLGFTTESLSKSIEHTRFCPGGRNPRPCTDSPPGTACPADATTWRSQLAATRPDMSVPASNGFTVSSGFVVISIETDPEPPPGGGPHATTTKFRCDLGTTTFPSAMTTARPACSCAEFEAKECTRGGPVTELTSPGSQAPGGPGAPSPGSTRREFTGPPQCTTCDQLAIDSSTGARDKFTCLDGMLDRLRAYTGAGPKADVIASVAARMELVLQLAGDRLADDQVSRAEAIYDEEPAAHTVCRVPLAWDASCQPVADELHVTGQLQLCQDLGTNSNAPQTAIAKEGAHCTAQLATLDGVGDACRLAMRDTAAATVETVIEKGQPSFAANFSVALPTAFARIGAWWPAATTLAHGDQPWFLGREGGLLRWLWSTIEAQKMPLPPQDPTTDAQAAALLADVASTRFANDVALLTAAFGAGQSGSAPPLLTMTGDAFQALADRVARLEVIHDVGCRFATCKNGTTLRTSATSELVRALSTLPDKAALTTALATATHLQQQMPDLYTALGRIRDQHAYLENAWSLLGRSEPFTSLGALIDPPVEAARLAAIVRNATVAWSSYQASGQFEPWSVPRLTAATLRQSDLVGFVDTMVANLNAANVSYTNARLATVNDLLGQSRSGAAMQSETDQLTAMRARVVDLAARIDGIDQREITERTGLAAYQTQFEALAQSGVLDDDAAYQVQTLTTLRPTAADAKYPGLDTSSKNVVRDRFAMVPLNTGESLRIKVTGEWAPDCSVVTSTLFDPVSNLPRSIDLEKALTGPEGYLASWETDHYSIDEHLHESGSSGGTTLKVEGCFELPIPFVKVGSCLGHSDGDSNSNADRDSQGSATKVSASFTAGLHLKSTPYREAPAGSLVAVITRPGVTGVNDPRDLDVRVVHRDDVIVAHAVTADPNWPHNGGVEVHFVINDRGTPPAGTVCLRDPSALQIEMIRSIPFGNVAKQLGAAMADTLAAVENQAPKVIAQGELSVAEETALRADAWVRVQNALKESGIGLGGLPYELRQLFEGFLERELASIGRRSQRAALQRQIDQLGIEMDSITDQQQFTQDQDRLHHLVPRWRLRDLSGIELSTSTGALSEALTAYVAPIFELRDPASLTSFRTQVSSQMSQIIDLQVTAPYEDSVANLKSFATATRNAIQAAQFELPTAQRRTIIIAVPRPPGNGRPAWTGPWQTVSGATANAFWNSIQDPQGNLSANANLTLSPGDIYTTAGGASRLSCQDLAPVVRHIGLFFATGGNPATLGPAGVELSGVAAAAAPVSFPLVGSVASFESTDPLGIPLSFPALNGDTFSVLGDPQSGPNFGVWPSDLGAGAGISPFTSFRIDMRAFGPPASTDVQTVLTKANALFLVFDVERRTSVPVASVPGVCQ